MSPAPELGTTVERDLLEARYRRLVRLYPRVRRDEFGEELVGVLLDSARPDQTRPTVGDGMAILRAALRGHFDVVAGAATRSTLPDAMAVLAVVLPALLATRLARTVTAISRWPHRSMGTLPAWSGYLLDGWAAPIVWFGVVMALIAQRFRLALAAAVAATVLDLVHVAGGTTGPNGWLARGLAPQAALAVVAVVLVARRSVPTRGTDLVGRGGLAATWAGLTLAYVALVTGSASRAVVGDVNLALVAGGVILVVVVWARWRSLRHALWALGLLLAAIYGSTQLATTWFRAANGGHLSPTAIVLELAASLALIAAMVGTAALLTISGHRFATNRH